jgi:hypothetical protein
VPLQRFVSAVAERGIGRVLALAKPGIAILFGGELFGREGGAFMAAIAKRLRRRFAAGAEPIILACLKGDFGRRFSGNGGLIAHAFMC